MAYTSDYIWAVVVGATGLVLAMHMSEQSSDAGLIILAVTAVVVFIILKR